MTTLLPAVYYHQSMDYGRWSSASRTIWMEQHNKSWECAMKMFAASTPQFWPMDHADRQIMLLLEAQRGLGGMRYCNIQKLPANYMLLHFLAVGMHSTTCASVKSCYHSVHSSTPCSKCTLPGCCCCCRTDVQLVPPLKPVATTPNTRRACKGK